MGKATLSQATVGAQIGGQAYIEIIFFENAEALEGFKKGEWTMAAQVSAVAVTAGAAKNASYTHGVAVFTLIKGGAMAEASVGGQKFSYEPLGAKKKQDPPCPDPTPARPRAPGTPAGRRRCSTTRGTW